MRHNTSTLATYCAGLYQLVQGPEGLFYTMKPVQGDSLRELSMKARASQSMPNIPEALCWNIFSRSVTRSPTRTTGESSIVNSRPNWNLFRSGVFPQN